MDIETIVNLLFFLIFGYESISYFISYLKLRKRGVNTIANVVGVKLVQTSISHVYYSTISFKTLSGNVIEQKLKIGFTFVLFKMYSTLNIIYSENNPEKFIVNEYKAKIIQLLFFVASMIHLYFVLIKI